jgi:protocatechuate 3,4-dioxygenase beta subunit
MSDNAERAWIIIVIGWYVLLVGGAAFAQSGVEMPASNCKPTPPDVIGPFYQPGAPVRSMVGQGYVLTGRVLSAGSCQPVPNARIEIWLAGPQGQYGDAYRATVLPDAKGYYRFECDPPPAYYNRPPHIHIMVSAVGHERLITQQYPVAGSAAATFDLVLEPIAR